ncbi:FtsW/RodA/SpoVE family cell cycle protein [bacterium]|nr:FtsW/RodA/SpoVE family cell cycle protein [bacterium]MCB2179358.1 FtsW/RodA/SpoVE family cell cycle protein [bacterium]
MTTLNQTNTNRKRSMGGLQLGVDLPLLIATIFLVLFGLVMVFSASWELSYYEYDGSHTQMFTRQLIFMLIGVVVAVVVSFLDYHHYRRWAVVGMGGTILALLVVLIVREVRFNATRTIYDGSIMPSEAAKLAVILYLCVWLYSKRNQLNQISFGLFPLGGIIGVVGGLILAQPDVSAVFTLVVLGGVLFFLAGGDLKQIFILLMIAILIGWLIVQLQPTARIRMADYFEGLRSPTQASFHVRRSIESFVRGGVFGAGIDNAETKLISLPVPPTDSIFAVVAEETGLVGTTFLIVLYAVLAWRGMKIAQSAPDMLGQLLAAGLTFWIVMEAIINMAMMVGLLPFAGNALPFISLGGSNLVVSLTSIGILMNVSRLSKAPEAHKERKVYASDGLRRRDRRRNLPRAGRTASPRG